MTVSGEDQFEGDVDTVADEYEYEDGDVNQLDDQGSADGDLEPGGDVDDAAGNRPEGSTPDSVLRYIARSLADEPDAVVVEGDSRRGSLRLSLHVAPDDMGRVIGRRGRTAQAIRTLVGAAGARDGLQTSVDIVDDD